MLFNCFQCGKRVSSKKDMCVYCKTDVSEVAAAFRLQQEKATFSQRYTGTLFSFLRKGTSKNEVQN